MAFFFFNDTATTEIYTLSLHDALPIYASTCLHLTGMRGEHRPQRFGECGRRDATALQSLYGRALDRKSTRLNSSHANISYAVFCLKKKTGIPLNLRSSDSSIS